MNELASDALFIILCILCAILAGLGMVYGDEKERRCYYDGEE